MKQGKFISAKIKDLEHKVSVLTAKLEKLSQTAPDYDLDVLDPNKSTMKLSQKNHPQTDC